MNLQNLRVNVDFQYHFELINGVFILFSLAIYPSTATELEIKEQIINDLARANFIGSC